MLVPLETGLQSYLYFGNMGEKMMSDFGEMKWIDRTIQMQDIDELSVSSDCVEIVKFFEGFEEEAYLCPAGKPTLGYGETQGVKMGDTITEKVASDRLKKRLEEDFASYVRRVVQVPVTQYMMDSLVSLVYNIGTGNFVNSTLLKKLNQGDYEGAAEEFPKWRRGGGRVLKGLERRREAERAMFLGQDWRGTVED